MEMTRREVIELNNTLNRVGEIKGNIKFSYGVAKNKQLLATEIKAIEESTKVPTEIEEYERKRIELCVRYSDKDETGRPKFDERKNFSITENVDKFKEDYAKLFEEYKTNLTKYQEWTNNLETFYSEKVEVKVSLIRLKDLPDGLTPKDVEGLLPIIDDEEEEDKKISKTNSSDNNIINLPR